MIKKLKNKVIKYLMKKDIEEGKFDNLKSTGIKITVRTELSMGKTNYNNEITIYEAITKYFIYDEEHLKNSGIVKIPEIKCPPKIKQEGDKEIYELQDMDMCKGLDLMYQRYFWDNYYSIRGEYIDNVNKLFSTTLTRLVNIIITIITTILTNFIIE